VRIVDGVQFGDLPEFVDFGYVAQVARVTPPRSPARPRSSILREVEMENLRLEADTTLRWKPNRARRRRIPHRLWETTSALWQNSIDVAASRHTLVSRRTTPPSGVGL
jgi:hypothetical protein